MKQLNLTIAILTVLATMSTANAAETTTTTTEYTQKVDESITSSKRLIVAEKKSDREIHKSLDARIDIYPNLNDEVSFTVQDGIVILKGAVENTSDKDYTAMMAAAIPGVSRVDNLITVE